MTSQENVDQRELRKFEQLANRWWDPQGEFKTLHDINPLRLNYIEQHASLADRDVVDVGCGGGLLSEAMASRGARVTGIDMAPGPLSVARLHKLESGAELEYLQTTAESFSEDWQHRFDVVTCLELLEHVPDPASLVRACGRLVKPGGAVFFSTINRNPKAWLLAVLGAEYLLRLLPAGTHSYERFVRPAELAAWCRETGLRPAAMTGLHYSPVTRRYRMGPGVDVNYMAFCSSDEVRSRA
jgi:2-polyprenyl-6-hydroxyphenyl methylase/3-demethylubiquinone-9 3-methyltransferase